MEEKTYTVKVNINTSHNGAGIQKEALENAIGEFLGRGIPVGTLEHSPTIPDIPIPISKVACKVNNMRFTEDNGLVAEIIPSCNFEGPILESIMKKTPDKIEFGLNGVCHNEKNAETGEEELVVDDIFSINATIAKD